VSSVFPAHRLRVEHRLEGPLRRLEHLVTRVVVAHVQPSFRTSGLPFRSEARYMYLFRRRAIRVHILSKDRSYIQEQALIGSLYTAYFEIGATRWYLAKYDGDAVHCCYLTMICSLQA
jgi:hypothetical protein